MDYIFYGRREGWPRALLKVLSRLTGLLYCRKDYEVLAYCLKDLRDNKIPEDPIRIFQAGPDDLEKLKDLVPPSIFSLFSTRLSRGRMLFLALDGTQPAGYCWAALRVEEEIDQVRIELSPDDAYGVDAFTFPDFRRRGIQAGLQHFRLLKLKSLGVRRLLVIVERDNLASLHLHQKAGFEVANHLTYRRWLWRRIYQYRNSEHRFILP